MSQGYKFASNEYRLFPVRFQLNFCEALARDVTGMQNTLLCGNFTGCPFVKVSRDCVIHSEDKTVSRTKDQISLSLKALVYHDIKYLAYVLSDIRLKETRWQLYFKVK